MQFASRPPLAQPPGVDVTTMWNIFWGEGGEVEGRELQHKSFHSAPAPFLFNWNIFISGYGGVSHCLPVALRWTDGSLLFEFGMVFLFEPPPPLKFVF